MAAAVPASPILANAPILAAPVGGLIVVTSAHGGVL